ncbi:hypothetical protein ACWDSJ_32705 [Nocardia sp. NPDC003482]
MAAQAGDIGYESYDFSIIAPNHEIKGGPFASSAKATEISVQPSNPYPADNPGPFPNDARNDWFRDHDQWANVDTDPNRYKPPRSENAPQIQSTPSPTPGTTKPPANQPAPQTNPVAPPQEQPQPTAGQQEQTVVPVVQPKPVTVDPFGLPDTTGHREGDQWEDTVGGVRRVNTIPQGNGTQTVDQVIYNADGTVTFSRVVANDHGGYQRWNNDSTGTASYLNKGDAGADAYIQSFDTGTSTSERPSRESGASGDWGETYSPSYDTDGNRVGVDVGVRNPHGLYDNYHYDNYDNLTVSEATPDGKGGVTSRFIAQLDRNSEGWQRGPDGESWQVGRDLQGRITMGRTTQDRDGTHVYFRDADGRLFDSFYSTGKAPSYTTIAFGDTITKTLRDGTVITFDRNQNVTGYKTPPDRRDLVQKGWDWTVGVGSSLKSWGTDLVSVFDFSTNLTAAGNPLDPANQAAAAEHSRRTNAALTAPGRLVVNGVIDSGKTVADWYRYKIGGALYGLSGDPITPAGQARTRAALDQMAKAPSDLAAVLAATTFLIPETGAATRVGAVVARAGEDAAAAARRAVPSINLRVSGAGSSLVDYIGNGLYQVRTLPNRLSLRGVTALQNAIEAIASFEQRSWGYGPAFGGIPHGFLGAETPLAELLATKFASRIGPSGWAAGVWSEFGGRLPHPTGWISDHFRSWRFNSQIGEELAADIDRALASYPDIAAVVKQLIADTAHKLNLTEALKDPSSRAAALNTLMELAEGRLLHSRTLSEYLAENPGPGLLFEPVAQDVNFLPDGRKRMADFVSYSKNIDPARRVGAYPGRAEWEQLSDYAERLAFNVEQIVEAEVRSIAENMSDVTISVRTKPAAAILDKVKRMVEGSEDRAPRPTYEAGDAIDAVGARITVQSTDQLSQLLDRVRDRLGVGEGGRILEIENMYATPKSRNPSYRVIPVVVRVDVSGIPYTYELQLTTRRASVAADLNHNTVYKPYVKLTPELEGKIEQMFAEAAALEQEEAIRNWQR